MLIAQLPPVPAELPPARGLAFVGGSAAIDAGGRILARAGVEESLLEVDVPVGSPGLADDVDYLLHARPDLPVRVPATISSRRGG
jgi:hypothetical protein